MTLVIKDGFLDVPTGSAVATLGWDKTTRYSAGSWAGVLECASCKIARGEKQLSMSRSNLRIMA